MTRPIDIMTIDDMLQEFEDLGVSVLMYKDSHDDSRHVQIYKKPSVDNLMLIWYTTGVGLTRWEALAIALQKLRNLKEEIETEGGNFEDY
jgi:hypothetical protein